MSSKMRTAFPSASDFESEFLDFVQLTAATSRLRQIDLVVVDIFTPRNQLVVF